MIIRTEYELNPLGTDVMNPHFSWVSEKNRDRYLQRSYQIIVSCNEGTVWDTGPVTSAASNGIRYEGKPLKPCTEYRVAVYTTGENGEEDTGGAWFETGLMDTSEAGFEGAVWTGAPEKYLSSDRLGVFVLETEITFSPGSKKAGLVFGACDERLENKDRNIYGLSGENYIRYELDLTEEPSLNIFRVGYAPEDSKEVPLARVPLYPYEEQVTGQLIHPLITEENQYLPHKVRLEVPGNGALFYLDGVLTDAQLNPMITGRMLKDVPGEKIPEALKERGMSLRDAVDKRVLNPLGSNDITTFPRLHRCGYYAGAGDTVHFSGIRILNVREPGREILTMDPQGVTLTGINEEGLAEEKQIVKDPSVHSLPMFRRDFTVEDRPVKKARVYVTARGIYDLKINGKALTDSFFNPGLTEYDKRMNYQTYDVTELISAGENGIGLILGSGWWADSQTFTVANVNYFGDREAFLLKLEVTYEDGGRTVITSDPETWTYYGEGPLKYAGFFQGETFDGRRKAEIDDWSLNGCPLKSEKKPVKILPDHIQETWPAGKGGFLREWPELDYLDVKYQGEYQAPVRAAERITAKERFSPRPGVYVYDLQQEIAGVPVIRFKGEAGERAVIRYGEMLYPDLPEYGDMAGMMLTENYRDAESTDYYILSGDPEGEEFRPRFTFHGYRYIEITGVKNAPEAEDVESIQLSSVKAVTGRFETSDSTLNRLMENIRWSMLCNFISIPTDCPQRNERMGWAGDTHIFAKTATYEADMQVFYYRYLEAIRDLQKESGEMPMIAPMGGGFGGITYECAMIFIAHDLYLQYGDRDIVERFYPSMDLWMRHMDEIGMPGDVYVGPINDWLAFDVTDNGIVWNAFYLRSAALMKSYAVLLQKEEDAAYYEGRETLARTYWNDHFVDPETGLMHGADQNPCDTQCAYALGLAYDCFYEKDREQAAAHLARKVRESGYTIRTGFFGTPLLAPQLSEAGYTEDAYQLVLSREFPSWLYPVTQGATTIWERWNSYTKENGFGGNNAMNSFNHYSYGAVLSWIVEHVLGIRPDEEEPGFKHFFLKPEMAVLDYAKGGIETPYGRIESSWEKTEDGYVYRCTIPENTCAELCLSGDTKAEISWTLLSGSYEFTVE